MAPPCISLKACEVEKEWQHQVNHVHGWMHGWLTLPVQTWGWKGWQGKKVRWHPGQGWLGWWGIGNSFQLVVTTVLVYLLGNHGLSSRSCLGNLIFFGWISVNDLWNAPGQETCLGVELSGRASLGHEAQCTVPAIIYCTYIYIYMANVVTADAQQSHSSGRFGKSSIAKMDSGDEKEASLHTHLCYCWQRM